VVVMGCVTVVAVGVVLPMDVRLCVVVICLELFV